MLSVKEVADRLSVHPRTVKTMLKKGELQGYRVGGQWRVSEEQLQAYLESVSTAQSQ